MLILLWIEQEDMRKRVSKSFVSLHVLVFNEVEDYRKVLLYYSFVKMTIFGYFVGFFLTLFGMPQLLVAGYLCPKCGKM